VREFDIDERGSIEHLVFEMPVNRRIPDIFIRLGRRNRYDFGQR